MDSRSAFAAACMRSLTSASSRDARSMRSCWISVRSCWLLARCCWLSARSRTIFDVACHLLHCPSEIGQYEGVLYVILEVKAGHDEIEAVVRCQRLGVPETP